MNEMNLIVTDGFLDIIMHHLFLCGFLNPESFIRLSTTSIPADSLCSSDNTPKRKKLMN